uniref:Transposase (putative) gypsy type domain-containing protein n=1 Tax=Chenopodium quinoa TaxID=63459 RepID=A0A803M7B3_CHEQI
MSNSSIEEEQPTLNTTRRRLIRQSLWKDLGRTGETTSSLSDNIDDPFQSLSVEEQKKAFYRHKLLVECEKTNRPVNPNIPEDTEILEVEPVSVRYHLRSFADTQFDQYSSNVGHIGISTMPRVRSTSYQPEVVARDATEEAESSKKAKEDQVALPSESDDTNTLQMPREMSLHQNDIIDMTAEIIQEENLDEGYNSETDGAEFRQPIALAARGKVAGAKINEKFRQTALEKDYCQRAKRFYKLPDGYDLCVPPSGSSVLDCPDGHVAIYLKHFDFGLRFPLHPFVVKILKAWNVCLVQLTPPTIRVVIALIWVLLHSNYPLTLNAFRRLLTLKRDGQSDGWWSLYTQPHKYTVHPKLSSCKGWQDKFFFMSVPDDFPLRRTFFRPHPKFESIPERNLGKHERRAVNHFAIIESDNGDGRVRITPKVWVPNAGYILANAPLSHVGVDKLDNKLLGLSADSKRVIRRCPKATKPLYDTLTTHYSRTPTVSAKRKAESMADENAKKRKTTSLANRWGTFPRSGITRQPEDRNKKNQAENKKKPPSPRVQVKTVVQSSDAVIKKVVDSIDVEDLTNVESPTLPQPNIPDQPAPQTVTTAAGGSDTSAPALIYQSNQRIERPNERIPEVVLKGFSVLLGHSGDKWQPAIDACRNESMITDDPMLGGTLGYRLLSNLTLPVDRPAGVIGLLAAMHMHNMMKAVMSALDNADKALQKLKEAKERDDLEMSSLKETTSKVKDLELEVQKLKTQITEKNKIVSRVSTLEKDLEAAKGSVRDLQEKIKVLEAYKPGIRQRAVRRFLTSQEFCTRIQNRFDGGLTSAQRCIAHTVGWKKEDWTAIEKAFNEEVFKIPSGFEEQEFADEDLFNLAPAEDEGISDPSILDSPASDGTQA